MDDEAVEDCELASADIHHALDPRSACRIQCSVASIRSIASISSSPPLHCLDQLHHACTLHQIPFQMARKRMDFLCTLPRKLIDFPLYIYPIDFLTAQSPTPEPSRHHQSALNPATQLNIYGKLPLNERVEHFEIKKHDLCTNFPSLFFFFCKLSIWFVLQVGFVLQLDRFPLYEFSYSAPVSNLIDSLFTNCLPSFMVYTYKLIILPIVIN
ncbi:hypothetical protein LXL04_011655 [Taraxacum kok-saghyz]